MGLLPEDLCRLVQAQAAGAAVLAGGNGADRYLDVFRSLLGSEAVRAQIAGPSALAVGRLALARLARGEHGALETSVPRCHPSYPFGDPRLVGEGWLRAGSGHAEADLPGS
jgi:hypothetical protein